MADILRLPLRLIGRRTHHPVVAVCAVFIGPYMVAFHSRLFGLGLADLKGAFGLSFDEGAWLSTLATAPQIFVAPAIAWLAATFGVRRVMVGPAILYALISAVIPTVHEYSSLVVLHVIHGTLLGVFVPATVMMIFRNLPVKWWITAIALYAFRSAFTLNSGTALLDVYVQHFGWQCLYWQDVFLAPIMGFLVFMSAPHEDINYDLLKRADWGGMLLFGGAMAMLFIAVDQGNRLDWLENGLVVSFLSGGILLLFAFLVNESLVENPWAHVSAVGTRNIVLLLAVALLYMMTSLSNSSLVPGYLMTVGGLRPEQIGETLVHWVCVPMIVATPLAIWAMHRCDGRMLLLAGLSGFAVAALIGTNISPDWSRESFRTMCVLFGVAQIFTFLPIIVLCIAHGDPKMAIATGAYIQVIRLLGVQMAQALMTTFLRKSEQLHSQLIGANIERGSQQAVAALEALSHQISGAGHALANARATAFLARQVKEQAIVVSYIDAFWLTFICALAGLVILGFVDKAPKGPLTN